MYKTFAKSGDAYLEPASLDNYTKRFAMSGRALEKLTQALNVIKEEAKIYLKELLRDNGQGQQNKDAELGYLTSTWVEDDEMPF